jgi:hypothetical protein
MCKRGANASGGLKKIASSAKIIFKETKILM